MIGPQAHPKWHKLFTGPDDNLPNDHRGQPNHDHADPHAHIGKTLILAGEARKGGRALAARAEDLMLSVLTPSFNHYRAVARARIAMPISE